MLSKKKKDRARLTQSIDVSALELKDIIIAVYANHVL